MQRCRASPAAAGQRVPILALQRPGQGPLRRLSPPRSGLRASAATAGPASILPGDTIGLRRAWRVLEIAQRCVSRSSAPAVAAAAPRARGRACVAGTSRLQSPRALTRCRCPPPQVRHRVPTPWRAGRRSRPAAGPSLLRRGPSSARAPGALRGAARVGHPRMARRARPSAAGSAARRPGPRPPAAPPPAVPTPRAAAAAPPARARRAGRRARQQQARRSLRPAPSGRPCAVRPRRRP
jgi:hypothetical protein